MSSATVCHYSDREQLERAYQFANVELTPTQHGPFEARVVNLKFDPLHMQRVDESTPRIKWAAQSPRRAFFRFLMSPGPPLAIDGVRLQNNELIHFSKGHNDFERSFGPVSWGALTLPVEDPAAGRLTMAGRKYLAAVSHARSASPRRIRKTKAVACGSGSNRGSQSCRDCHSGGVTRRRTSAAGRTGRVFGQLRRALRDLSTWAPRHHHAPVS